MKVTKHKEMIEKARVFATAAHASVNQVRKYTGEPYIVHPLHVARIVESVPHTDAMVAAALLHDVIEDTGVTESVLRTEFGDEVTDLVVWLTKVSKLEHGNRKVRKERDRAHLAKAPREAQTIKLADLIANSETIIEHDPKFAKIFLEEMRLLIEVLTKGDPILIGLAKLIVEKNQPLM